MTSPILLILTAVLPIILTYLPLSDSILSSNLKVSLMNSVSPEIKSSRLQGISLHWTLSRKHLERGSTQ